MAERLYYGSLEYKKDINSRGIKSEGNGDMEVLELSETSLAARENHSLIMQRMEAEKRARKLVLPTSIQDVISALRKINHPVTLFGENAADRRERLRMVLAQNQVLQSELATQDDSRAIKRQEMERKELEEKLFYTAIKNNVLKVARGDIAKYSFIKSEARLEEARQKRIALSGEELDKRASKIYDMTYRFSIEGSQVGDSRPLPVAKLCKEMDLILTGSWSSVVKTWNADDLSLHCTYKGHTERITDAVWHNRYEGQNENTRYFFTGSADSTAKLWHVNNDQAVNTFKGHKARLGKIAIHPMGRHGLTTSFDHTWCLWDLETANLLQLQEGHYQKVYAIACHPDGSLVATGDLDGIGRLWDIRSGKSILTLQGHSKQIMCMDFANNGYTLASGSDDRTVRIWDIRKRSCVYTVPAHNGLVSGVQFSPCSGEYMVTSSFDGLIRIWRTRDWMLLKELQGHDGKVMSIDISSDEKRFTSSGFDRTFKVWLPEATLTTNE